MISKQKLDLKNCIHHSEPESITKLKDSDEIGGYISECDFFIF